jgi:sigma-B regulation protein RsbU (phosphoserine phosphatase)
LLCGDGQCQYLEYGGIPLGGFPQPFYEDRTVILPPGSALVLYSDGFVEMVGRDGALLGFERFQQMAAERCHLSAMQMVSSLVDTTLRFEGKRLERDDLTLVVVKRSPRENDAGFSALPF